MTKKLAGKVALVTGASKGIGAVIAEHLAAEGAAVVVNYGRSKAEAEALVQRIEKQGGKAVAIQADVSKPAEVKRLLADTKQAFDKLDILVNNAGVYDFAPLEAITPEHFHKHFDLNVLGLLLATQEAVKLMGSAGGSIINLSSIVAAMPARGSVGIQRHQGGRRRDHRLVVARTGAQEDSRQFDQSRHDRNRGAARHGHRRERLSQAGGSGNAAGANRPARRHCQGGGLFRFG